MSLLSRVAERIYWTGRYLERVENSARLLNVYGNLLLDLPTEAGLGWQHLIDITDSEALFAAHVAQPSEENTVAFLVADLDNPGSILSSLTQARENIRTSRDIVPTEAWRCVNELHLYAKAHLTAGVSPRRRHETLTTLVERCQQITGLLAGTMSHGTAYQFLRLGRNVERADMTSRVLDVAAATLLSGRGELVRFDNTLWMTVLKSLSAYQMYRQQVRRRIIGADVIAFLVHDDEFPRALTHCLAELPPALTSLPRAEQCQAAVKALRHKVAQLDMESVAHHELHAWIDEFQLGLAALHNQISASWFALESAA